MAAQFPDPVEKQISDQLKALRGTKAASFQSFAGTDIQATMYLPLITRGSITNPNSPKVKVFADLQTISISSTRSVSPVRTLGRASPLTFTRGARTFAGTLVFATINKDAFQEIYDVSMAESAMTASTSMVSDQLPPFSVVITASNESGGIAAQIIHGITLVNYGTTYSVDDLYTETTYSYVAQDASPLSTNSRAVRDSIANSQGSVVKTISDLISDSMGIAYSAINTISDKWGRRMPQAFNRPDLLE